MIEGPTRGWSDPLVVAGFVVAAVAGPAFLVVESASVDPMLPLDALPVRQFSGANAVTFVVYGALGGALFLLPVELQVVAHYSPLDSGLALLPVTVIMLLFSARSGQLSARIGPRLQMSVGPVLVGAGLALLARATTPGSYWMQVFPAVVLFGAGLAVTVAPLTSTAMGAAPAEHSGIASAVNNTVARAAGLFAVALLPLLAGLTGAAGLVPAELAAGFRTAVFIAGATCAAGGLVAVLTIRNPRAHAAAGRRRSADLPLRPRRPAPARVARTRLSPCSGALIAGPPVDVRAGASVGQGRPMPTHAASAPPRPRGLRSGPLGPLTLRNRIIKAATFEGVMPGGTVSDALVEFHRRVAAGGVAMTTVAYLAVSPEGRTDRHCLLLNEDNLHGPAPAHRRRPRRGRRGGRADRPRRSRGQRALQPGPGPLAVGRLHPDGLAPARRRRRRHRAHHRGLPPRRRASRSRPASTASRCTSGTTTS